ncbi:MAG: hypothetical protein CME62_14430 [Halobacteriovoraceae bacterium]|nr:hypothetical protein [Halobacteriovoraceae bacterium]|tara:strand:- start:8536 stop:9288 length:753 start_codon:yes stop_codon:yes gene_type:complete
MRILFAFILVLSSFSTYALTIISDLDDTIKVTEVRNRINAARNALTRTHAYEPMPLLYNEMAQYTNDLYIVSGSPKLFNRFIQKFYINNNLDVTATYTRGIRDLGNSYKFKINTISALIEESNDTFILIGDNTEKDPLVYQEIKRRYPERIENIYIHRVYAEEELADQTSFITAFDIAEVEYFAGRMSFEQVRDVANKILFAKDMKQIIPKFAFCPTNISDFNKTPLSQLTLMAAALKTKIIGYCKLRHN